MATGQTFRDTGSPGSFEAIPLARQQVAHHIWYDLNLRHRAEPFMPIIDIAPSPPVTSYRRIVHTRQR
jgi:hypothetical protein